MKLKHYLICFNVSAKDFASRLDDVTEDGVANWVAEKRIPRTKQMRDIFRATDGLVTPNDFHGIGLSLMLATTGE